jgi:peptide chain release factor 3
MGKCHQLAGSVKGKRGPHAKSDWMTMEQERGISVTSSVMQFPYKGRVVNLLDTPGHEDFSEDTYRTLTAVDSVLMMIDGAKGVEDRTIKLMEVCRLRDTPILSFINKMDRESRDPVDLLDEIERVLKITSAPNKLPLGSGRTSSAFIIFYTDTIHVYQQGKGHTIPEDIQIKGLDSAEATKILGSYASDIREEIEFVRGATNQFDINEYLAGR